ncbi:MAG: hypothetical protein DME05_10435 [Candidatus Rokuibacteriota bacterium]|nr:MAG: hypothetical protein DME05_10435 [Candidatus Rokubacteria bacterium]
MRPGSADPKMHVHMTDNRSSSSSSVLAVTVPEAAELGLYVHVPFCAKRCGYCSFNTAPLEDGAMARYLAALHREIDLLGALAWAPRVRLATVFFGGGTPSLLADDDMAAALDGIRARFDVAPDAEITVECNPESVTREKLAGYRGAGVNRLSLGVQSLDDAILPRLGRLHDARGARAAFDAAREAGCANLSVDVMYGLPGLDLDGWARAVDAVLDWRPDHLSAYGLTLDAGSLWGAAGVEGIPAEQVQIALRDLQLRAAGLSLAPQPDLLARRRIPRGRTGRVRLRGFHALRERQGDAALLRGARRGRPPDRLVRAALVAAEARRAADPRAAHR